MRFTTPRTDVGDTGAIGRIRRIGGNFEIGPSGVVRMIGPVAIGPGEFGLAAIDVDGVAETPR